MTKMKISLTVGLFILFHATLTADAQPGFVSIDCGGAEAGYTDEAGIDWVPDGDYVYNGTVANVSGAASRTFQTLRYFPGGQEKFCYGLGPLDVSSRYLVRASFLYGSYDAATAFPSFRLSLDTSPWATITIVDASTVYTEEFIAVATGTNFTVCLYRGTTGNPFISTLELRPLAAAMYSVPYLDISFLRRTVRINFGALSDQPLRFPDDPTDRIWVSDRVYPLQDPAPQTTNISTTRDIIVNTTDRPPVKVMQTAVVGGPTGLSYRLNLADYPASCYAVIYFAEIQELGANQSRAFFFRTNIEDQRFDGVVLNLARDVGVFEAFEPGYYNATLPNLVTFQLLEDNSSTLPPLMNAMEIYQIMPIVPGTFPDDVTALSTFKLQLPPEEVVGDPCLPEPWDFLTCNSESPPRVSSIKLSSRNLTGSIPANVGGMTGLVDLWLDNNQLTGSIPDFGQLTRLQTLHLQNNQLSGEFPSSLGGLQSLTEIFVENNSLSGTVPASLLEKGGVLIRADGNLNLCASLSCAESSDKDLNLAAMVGGIVGGVVVLAFALLAFFFWRKLRKRTTKDRHEASRLPFQEQPSFVSSELVSSTDNPVHPGEGARLFHLAELQEATENFSREIGSGGFGPVYYGRLGDGEEIAVKVLSASSNQGAREFYNEVNLLSRVHHRNLVILFGYCLDLKERMLIYEYMHKGSLRDHIYGPLSKEEPFDWITRLNIALDAAKGLEYLHSGCCPSIIHRDVKSSNILINESLSAKVADFGLSKLTSEGVTAVSTVVRGTVGYLDPEYYISQQLTTKSDVFSFGVVLLELISGREPILVSNRSDPDSNIVNWARNLLQRGNVQSMVDPTLESSYRMDSMWKLVELAISSVDQQGKNRPTMNQIVLELTEIIRMERPNNTFASASITDSFPTLSSARSTSMSPSMDYDTSSEIPASGRLSESFDSLTVR
ncbi:hypothetical protein MPTK1_1g17720 [Marchantia polymorpha subsp. ruderalis]|uniref:non-specific serine/threonine protein kinase n=2 Tax=Marchantia polymorpha TaxID=3197 RepID=A0AAF6ARA7_MARPO|nr:hypothetical protein MARPO_0001s0111 [Marchantia polymorpha]BBM98977.1 hypothetical protein Mp_1g17720 [Marchantia polymorpha subsp. ruderalis]|eukprot:PTQ50053.1 hypothetical protein MARPO_0001s0111 [Marchantia polymorpha]